MIRTTLLSAALQEYPDKRVVLLIDDPYVPKTRKAASSWSPRGRCRGRSSGCWPSPPAGSPARCSRSSWPCSAATSSGPNSMTALASAYGDAVSWLENLADRQEIIDHTDEFFVNEIVLRLAESFREVRTALLDSAAEGVVLHPQMFRRLYRRLAWTFSVRVSSFERKKYVSLSHEPNKAMNLNSYIGLMGGTYHEIQTVGGTALVPARPGTGWDIPDPDYVVTLDADSVLLPEYCLRLVHLLEQQEHQDVAVAQTPYSAFPGLGHPPGADRRCDHRPAAHRAPGHDVLRRHLLGRRQRGDPQEGPRRHRRDLLHRRLGDQAVHQGPHGHRGHRVHDRHGHPRLAAVQLPRAAQLQRDPARLRLAVHPAAPLGQRRPADPAQAAAAVAGPAARGQADQVQRAVPALELHGLHLLELGQPADPARLPVHRRR